MNNIDSNFIIKITTSCPGQCLCCINRKNNIADNNSSGIFDIKVYEKLCKCIKNIGGTYICLSGGEPTLIPNLNEYILIANNAGLSVRLNTNGWNVTKDKIDSWLSSGLDQIVLSLYGTDRDTVEKTRGNALLYEKAMHAVSLLGEYKNIKKFIFIIQTVIMKTNYKYIPKIFEIALKNRADLFWASYLEDAVHLDEIRMSTDDIHDFKTNIIPLMQKTADKYDLENIKSLHSSLKGYYNDFFLDYKYHKKGQSCSWIGNHFTFYPNGRIDPCPGHEYFRSNYQWKIDYNNIEEFVSLENLHKYRGLCFNYCQFCPQGIHHEVYLTNKFFHEHSKKEDIL